MGDGRRYPSSPQNSADHDLTMRVVLTGTFNQQDTGPSRVAGGLAEGLANRGVDVVLLAHGDRTDHPNENVSVRHLGPTPSSVPGFFRLYWRIHKFLSEESFDVFHPLEEYPGESAVRTVQWTVDDYERLRRCPDDFRGYGFLAGEAVLNLANLVGCLRTRTVVASSPETERQMEEYWRHGPDAVIPLGIEETDLSPPEPHDDVRVLVPGRITPKKGQKRILDGLDPRSSAYVVDLVGGVADESYYESLSRWHDRHHGFVAREALNRLYDGADIVVVPSVHENFSMTALEGIAHGCVVVVTEQCGFAQFEWATPENGIYVVADGTEAAEVVERLSQREIEDQRRSAHRLARTMVWGEIAGAYLELYVDALRDNHGPV